MTQAWQPTNEKEVCMTVAQGTPRTDAFIAELESELGDGPPHISEAAIDVSIRLRLITFARQLEADNAALSAQVVALDTAAEYANKVADRWQSRAVAAEAQVVELQQQIDIKNTLLGEQAVALVKLGWKDLKNRFGDSTVTRASAP